MAGDAAAAAGDADCVAATGVRETAGEGRGESKSWSPGMAGAAAIDEGGQWRCRDACSVVGGVGVVMQRGLGRREEKAENEAREEREKGWRRREMPAVGVTGAAEPKTARGGGSRDEGA